MTELEKQIWLAGYLAGIHRYAVDRQGFPEDSASAAVERFRNSSGAMPLAQSMLEEMRAASQSGWSHK